MAVSSQPDMAELAAVFGGSAPHSLSEYYAAASGIPASGAISLSQFIGKSGVTQKTFTVTEANTEYFNGYGKDYGVVGTVGGITSRSLNGLTLEAVGLGFGFVLAFTGNHTVVPFNRLWIQGGTWFDASDFIVNAHEATYNYTQMVLNTDISDADPGWPYRTTIANQWNGSGTSQIIAEY